MNSPGASDGATKVIREEGTGAIVAYAWSAGTRAWERLGEVTGVGGDTTEAGGGRKTLDGVAYDYVFDVDIQEGAPTLKLPFNAGDNPYDAAERFLESNGLDPGYRERWPAIAPAPRADLDEPSRHDRPAGRGRGLRVRVGRRSALFIVGAALLVAFIVLTVPLGPL